ncbi:hypothetical protein Acor_35330 [Acrocarpospora corrugata]|uniref:ATP/GTP-binding protein n=1 Tax=Acrocarpospora corrugata TaxID=35763 RepID=A0A5M3VZM8_9ACTN|nr:FxSxx-COOH system tetratricopeptide repeat protein [Acrocarpospora corrugata]GES01469.1 hypothetical protein Acor_35330 [Acrocarpospora corrugata]
MASDLNGKIITFYSFKGGTGRTMALANTAWILASQGRRVLVIDWDLESPGLHRFFHPFLDVSVIAATKGVVDMIADYQWATTTPHAEPDWHKDFARVTRHAVSLEKWDFPGDGTLDFLSAGRRNRDYSSLSTFDLDVFYERGGGQFLDALQADMRRHYDYTLIDSRTGFSDIADICTIALPDVLVDCFTMSDQSIDGAAEVARIIDKQYPDQRIRILPVLMRVDDGEKKKVDAGRMHARDQFIGFPKGLSGDSVKSYWATIEVPYKRFYAFEETLATFGDSPGSPGSLLSAYERLTAAITESSVTGMPPMEESVRLRWLEAFTRRQPTQHPDVRLSYAPEDRMWADWVMAVLEQAGFRVTPQTRYGTGDRSPTQDLPESASTVVILSSAYLRGFHRDEWPSGDLSTGMAPEVVALRVSEAVRLTMPIADRPPVDLVRLGPEDAAEAVLRAVGRGGHGHDMIELSQLGTRYPGTQPSIWSVGTRNASFTGRNLALETLRNQLLGSSQAVVLPQALYGMGGVGKTQVALEYAHRFAADYDLVWWIPAEQPDLINPMLAELARRIGLPVSDSVVEGALAAREALRRGEPHARWLLIFDNAGDPEELKPFLPGGSGHVIVTSRIQTWSNIAAPLEVDVFSQQESVEHLLRRVPRLAPVDALSVAEELGFLPLAVEQAAAWLSETGLSASEYVTQLQKQAPRILAMNRPTDYENSVAATWNVSLEQLRSRSPAAERMLQLCAYFSPDPISLSLIYSDDMMRALLPYDDSLRGEKLVLGRVIREISRFALAKIDQGSKTIQVHRLVQTVIRDQMSPDDIETISHQVHHILVAARPQTGEVDDPENWQQYDLIWPHLLPSDAEKCVEEETRQLLTERVRYWWKRGEFDSAIQLGQRLADYWEEKFGQLERQRLHMLFNIANVLRSQGNFDEALKLDEWVLAQQSKTLKENHPHTLMTTGGLAADLRALGEFPRALEMDRNNHEQWKETYGEDYPRTLNSANNLAVSYRLVGDWRSAKELDEDTLRRMGEVFGPGHPYTLSTAQNLARDMREAGEFADSVALLTRTLHGYTMLQFDDYPDALRAAKSIAVSLRRAGDRQEALKRAQDTHDHYQRLFPFHPESSAAALELACCLSAVDDKESARDLAASVFDGYRARLGEQHPYTLVAANNLMTYRRGTGDLAGALDLGQQTLATMRDRLGDNHPFALSCTINVANCAADTGDNELAERLERQALTSLLTTLGRDHPDTLACQANYAITLRALGQTTQSAQVHKEALAAVSARLGEHHPSSLALREWRRVNRDLEPQPI